MSTCPWTKPSSVPARVLNLKPRLARCPAGVFGFLTLGNCYVCYYSLTLFELNWEDVFLLCKLMSVWLKALAFVVVLVRRLGIDVFGDCWTTSKLPLTPPFLFFCVFPEGLAPILVNCNYSPIAAAAPLNLPPLLKIVWFVLFLVMKFVVNWPPFGGL